MSSSGSNTGKVTTSRPTADAWCVLEWNSNSNPIIVDSVGISAAAYVQQGVVRVTFKNPDRFASGAYVVLGQQELGNAGGYASVTPQGSISSNSSVAVGLSGSCDVSVIGFNNASATSPSFATDTALNLRPRVNLAFFCMRSDNDIQKTGILNYGCDTQNMSVVSPSGTSGGMQVVPGAAVAPDGTNTAVGIRVTANSLGTRKVIQYSIPSQFSVAGKAWNASIYIKAGDSGRVLRGASANVLFYDNSTGNSPSVRLNLDTGVTAASTGSTDYVNHSIQDAGNGWYRVNLCSRGGAPGQYAGNRNFYIGLSSNFAAFSANETNWSGNGSIEAYLWGFQMEEGSVTTPYIPVDPPNEFRYSTDIYSWARNAYSPNCTISTDTIPSPVGNTPLKMVVTGPDPHIVSYNSAQWNIAPAIAAQRWRIRAYVKASESTSCEILMFGANESGVWAVDGNGLQIASKVFPIGTIWTRVEHFIDITNPSVRHIQARLDGPNSDGEGITIWWDGLSIERIDNRTTNVNPVPGDQDRLTVYSPGLTLSASALLNTRTKREATAYGTIVIPPSRTEIGVPYLENPYGVKAVRAVNAGTYEVEFNPPMGNTGYCVITSNEQETLTVSETANGEGSIPHTAEYGLNTLRRVSGVDDQRTLNAFRVSCLRQPSEANNPNLITNSFATGNVLPSPMTWGAYEYTTTAVSVANESALSGGLRSAMIAVSPNWVKCVKNSSGGRIAAGIPGGSNLTPGAYYRIKYYVVCDDQNFTGSNEIFCQSDNDASSDQVTPSSYVAGDKGTVRLIETFYRSVSGSNTMVLRASNSLPNGTALYITGVQVHRVLPFEPRGDFYQAGREQRINFMVFGGRSIYGSE